MFSTRISTSECKNCGEVVQLTGAKFGTSWSNHNRVCKRVQQRIKTDVGYDICCDVEVNNVDVDYNLGCDVEVDNEDEGFMMDSYNYDVEEDIMNEDDCDDIVVEQPGLIIYNEDISISDPQFGVVNDMEFQFDDTDPPPTTCYLEYQRGIMNMYHRDHIPFHVRADRAEAYTISEAKASWRSIALIFEFVRNKSLSSTDGDHLLKLFQSIMNHHNIRIPLPKTMKSVENACMRSIDKKQTCPLANHGGRHQDRVLYKDMEKFIYEIPTLFLGGEIGSLPNVESFYMNIIEMISNQLLNVDVDNFAFSPYIPNQPGEISYFSSGSVFKKLCDLITLRHGPGALTKASPLCIAISLDTATVNSSRNRSECPVVFSILNINETAQYQLLGYVPVRLPFSDVQLLEKMMGLNYSKSRAETIRKYMQRQMKRQYLDAVLSPIYELEQIGFLAQVGVGAKSTIRRFYSYLCLIVGDSEELGGKLTGHYCKTGCRICMATNVHLFLVPDATYPKRDDNLMDSLTRRGAELFAKQCVASREETKHDWTVEDHETNDGLKRAGLHHGVNPLYKYFAYQNFHRINSYHEAIVPDHLHTIQLGIMKYCISWTMQIVYLVQFLDPGSYGGNVSKIDTRIMNMDNISSYQFIESVQFRGGITPFFGNLSTSSTHSEWRGTGMMTGTLHGWQVCSMLLQLLFALVPQHQVLPSETNWWRRSVKTNIDPRDDVNIFTTVIGSITSCLDFYMLSRKRCFNDDGRKTFQWVVINMRMHIDIEYMLRNCLIRKLLGDPPSKKISDDHGEADNIEVADEVKFKAIKPHLCEHMAENVDKFGALTMTSDTQQTELILKFACKTLFEQTNKNYRHLAEDLLLQHRKTMRARNLGELVRRFENPTKAGLPSTSAVRAEADSNHEFLRNCKSSMLNYNAQTKRWESDELNRPTNPTFLHGFLDPDKLMNFIARDKTVDSEVFKVMQKAIRAINTMHHSVLGHHLTVKLFKGVNIYNEHHISDENGSYETFMLHCDRTYPRDKQSPSGEEEEKRATEPDKQGTPDPQLRRARATKPVFSFIEVYYEDAPAYARVMAIIELTLGTGKIEFLVVNQLIVTKQSPLLFPMCTYAIHPTPQMQHCFDIVLLAGKFRPVFGRPFLYRKGGNVLVTMSHDTIEKPISNKVKFLETYKFFIIPYERVGKTPSNEIWADVAGNEVYNDKRDSQGFPLYATLQQQSETLKSLERRFALKHQPHCASADGEGVKKPKRKRSSTSANVQTKKKGKSQEEVVSKSSSSSSAIVRQATSSAGGSGIVRQATSSTGGFIQQNASSSAIVHQASSGVGGGVLKSVHRTERQTRSQLLP